MDIIGLQLHHRGCCWKSTVNFFFFFYLCFFWSNTVWNGLLLTFKHQDQYCTRVANWNWAEWLAGHLFIPERQRLDVCQENGRKDSNFIRVYSWCCWWMYKTWGVDSDYSKLLFYKTLIANGGTSESQINQFCITKTGCLYENKRRRNRTIIHCIYDRHSRILYFRFYLCAQTHNGRGTLGSVRM